MLSPAMHCDRISETIRGMTKPKRLLPALYTDTECCHSLSLVPVQLEALKKGKVVFQSG